MRTGEIEGTVEKLVAGGEGLSRVGGLAVFVPGALPGEKFIAEIQKRTGDWCRTGVPQILEASPDRVEPFCALYGRCGGCTWQHISYRGQIKAKQSIVEDALKRQGGITGKDLPEIVLTPSRPDRYRSRIRPVMLDSRRAGFQGARSNRTVGIGTCPVVTAGVDRFFADPPPGYRSGDRPHVFGDRERYWASPIHPEASAEVGGILFRFPPQAFFQSNLTLLEDLVNFTVPMPRTDECGHALDLYGGVGLFGAFLARRYERVTGVDGNPESGTSWQINVGARGRFHADALEHWIRHEKPLRADLAVLDPPRTGLSPDVRGALVALGIPRISYVSCDPVTQARDLKAFLAAGYIFEAFGLFDLYPQTSHVETVARLVRRAHADR